MTDHQFYLAPGKSFPLGATVYEQGVNFSVFSKNSTGIELLLFDHPEAPAPAHVIRLDPRLNRTFHYWHVLVADLKPGQVYAYRAYGPFEPGKGLRFNPEKLLLDPYGCAMVIPECYDRNAATLPGDNTATAMRSVVADISAYDWEGDIPLKRPWPQTVIYEMHVGGFTRHPTSEINPELRGTYAGLVEKIPYLQELGITAVELMPVFQFDVQEAPEGLTNYWGYNPVSLFTPHCGYSSCKDPLGVLNEFRDMVKALHKAGIEVILDVVYNHTAEGGHGGPTFCYKGLENNVYYMLEEDKTRYANYSGTGNTLKANHSVVRRMILDSLHYWVSVMHVDGFRFDLASILSRDVYGQPLKNPPVLWDIESDPVLVGTKLIAEAWDAGGLYQVGSFIGERWKEWNGKFRDDVRTFLRGDSNTVMKVAQRFQASPDLYGHETREPEQSINFVTSHDGFTLNDLVSYNQKHNQANREGNRDGMDYNLSWNCGVEGPTDDPQVEELRVRQIKNFLTINLLALGAPMLLMGDEVRRTQAGNNNAYCQNNEISWFNWTLLEKNRDIHRFVKHLVSFRLNLDVFKEDHGMSLAELLDLAQFQWHGVKLNQPDWGKNSHSLALTVRGIGERFHFLLNAYRETLEFELPTAPRGSTGWLRIVDTSLASPQDFCVRAEATVIDASSYLVQPHSVVVLVAEIRKKTNAVG